VDRRRVSLWLPVVIYMGVLFFVSSLEQPTIPAGGDKPWHLIGYTGFGAVIARAFAGGFFRRMASRAVLLAIGSGVAYAVTDEIHQMFVPGRSADAADLIADSIGVTLGTIGCWACGIIAPFSRDEL
jgi:VanZ family protein